MALSEARHQCRFWTTYFGAVPKLLKNKDPKERFAAAYALAEVRSTIISIAIPDLLIVLEDPNEKVRMITAQSLGSIVEESKTVVPALIQRLEKDKSSKVRIQAVESLQQYGPEAKPAIAELVRASQKDNDPNIRMLAAKAIGRINTMPSKRGRKGDTSR